MRSLILCSQARNSSTWTQSVTGARRISSLSYFLLHRHDDTHHESLDSRCHVGFQDCCPHSDYRGFNGARVDIVHRLHDPSAEYNRSFEVIQGTSIEAGLRAYFEVDHLNQCSCYFSPSLAFIADQYEQPLSRPS